MWLIFDYFRWIDETTAHVSAFHVETPAVILTQALLFHKPLEITLPCNRAHLEYAFVHAL